MKIFITIIMVSLFDKFYESIAYVRPDGYLKNEYTHVVSTGSCGTLSLEFPSPMGNCCSYFRLSRLIYLNYSK